MLSLVPRRLISQNPVVPLSRSLSISAARKASRADPVFPVLQAPVSTQDESAQMKSKKTEDAFFKTLFACQSGGGEKGAKKHVEVNKKILVRERIRRILDDDSDFFEICTTAGLGLDYGDVPGACTVTGIGSIRGNLVMLIASDGSLKGGTSYPITVTKSLRAQEVAMENRIPCLYVVDSGGAFLPLQAEIFPDVKHGGRTFRNQAVMSGLGIPQVAIVAGPCTAGGAYTPTMSDEAIMVTRIGHVFLGGPPLVKAATGEVVSQEDLGGAKLHTSVSGVADYFAEDEMESFRQVRDIISGLNLVTPDPIDTEEDAPVYDLTDLDHIGGQDLIGKSDMLAVIARIVDGSRFSEFKAPFGNNLITGFCKLGGRVVGIAANCGILNEADGQKGSHFLQLCDARDVPVIYLQNNNGGGGGSEEDKTTKMTKAIKDSGKFAHSGANLGTPKITVNVGGLGGPQDLVAMCGPSFGARFSFSWPRAKISKHPLKLEAVAEETQPLFDTDFPEDSAQYAASRCTIDNVILPRETRAVLIKSLQIAMHNYQRRHGHRTLQQNSVIRV